MSNNITPLVPKVGQPEAGIRYGNKLVRDMTDAEIAQSLQQITVEQQQAQQIMQSAIMQNIAITVIANVLAFEHDRRTKKIRLPSELV